MRVAVLGSGSRGNCIAVANHRTTILIDAGYGARTIRKHLEALSFPTEVVALLVTHEHGDHSRGVRSVSRKFECPVRASNGTIAALKSKFEDLDARPISPHRVEAIGQFRITACHISHDAAEPLALLVEGTSNGASVAVAHDLGRPTAALKYLVRQASCLIVESNYDEVMLRSGPYPVSVQHRIAGSAGHLSNRTAGQFLSEVVGSHTTDVFLTHLSDNCNTPQLALSTIRAALKGTCFAGRITVATQGTPAGPVTVHGRDHQLELESFLG